MRRRRPLRRRRRRWSPLFLLEIPPITEPAKERIVDAVPDQEDAFADPKGSFVDLVYGDESVHVVQDENIVQNGQEKRNRTVHDA